MRLTPAMHQALGALATSPGYQDEPSGTTTTDRAGIESLGVYEATFAALLRRGCIELYDDPCGKQLARVTETGGRVLHAANEALRAQVRQQLEHEPHHTTGEELYLIGQAMGKRRCAYSAWEWWRIKYVVRVGLAAKGYFRQEAPDSHASWLLTPEGQEAMHQHHRQVAQQER